jgi:hypothetical protein
MNADYGPNSAAVTAFIESCRDLTPNDLGRLAAAWEANPATIWTQTWLEAIYAREPLDDSLAPPDYAALDSASRAMGPAAAAASRDEAWNAAGEAARSAMTAAVRRAAWKATRDEPWETAAQAARALVIRDLLTETQFATLTRDWRNAGLPLPEDSRNAGLPLPEEPYATGYGLYGAALSLVKRCLDLTPKELDRLAAAWDAAKAGSSSHDATRVEAREAARRAGRWPVWRRARSATAVAALNAGRQKMPEKTLIAASDAALALIVYDLITPKAFESLSKPWRDAGLPLPKAAL